ncbi:MAG: dihydrolipoamide acetyltransferase family protein [Fimbriiglobus sp.]
MDFLLPPVGEGLIEVELVRWLVAPGDAVRRGQPLLEVLSDKATMEVPSPFAGTVTEVHGEPGDKLNVGQVVLGYESAAAKISHEPRDSLPRVSIPIEDRGGEPRGSSGEMNGPGPVAAAPSIRLLARKLGLDLARIRGTGPGGRILHDDLTPFLATPTASKPPAAKHAMDLGTAGTKQKLAGVRRAIAERMVASKTAIPHYAYVDECDFTELVRLRGQLKEPFARADLRLTYLPFVLKAVARALKHVPLVNSTFDDDTGEVTLHDRYHIGIAVAAPAGLMVPVIRDVDRKDVAVLAAEIDRLSETARAGRVRPDDLRGGSFTVSSIGSIGGLISTPIVNRPEVGIVGIGKLVRRPVYDAAGDLRPADLVYLSFSFDHRIVDGAIGATFGNAVIRELERPAGLLLPDGFAHAGRPATSPLGP